MIISVRAVSSLCLPTSEEVSVLGIRVAGLGAGAHARCHGSLALILNVLCGYLHLSCPCELRLSVHLVVVVVVVLVPSHLFLARGRPIVVHVADGGGVRRRTHLA